MQVPVRRAEKTPKARLDYNITPEKYQTLKNELSRLLDNTRPKAIKEVERLALMGDFSENAAYQLAKGKLRGINRRLLEIEDILKKAEIIIDDGNNDYIRLGKTVTLEIKDKIRVYKILGSAETNPSANIISQNSPLGAALMNKRVGEEIKIQLADDRQAVYKILKIE